MGSFLNVCVTQSEASALPSKMFACGDDLINNEFHSNDKDIDASVTDTKCLSNFDKSSCEPGVDTFGAACSWCKCDSMSWLSGCVSQGEAVQLPDHMFKCQYTYKDRSSYLK